MDGNNFIFRKTTKCLFYGDSDKMYMHVTINVRTTYRKKPLLSALLLSLLHFQAGGSINQGFKSNSFKDMPFFLDKNMYIRLQKGKVSTICANRTTIYFLFSSCEQISSFSIHYDRPCHHLRSKFITPTSRKNNRLSSFCRTRTISLASVIPTRQ